ncbi:PQ-loop-domain-containing protein [Durotheca rogersii]|uniref:PQ-loop-domain-containing protein n=1 Tax=Durotheca rogersii TaxID=419775 RepID=UPI00221FC488|nr:PQ-loop-domain-containing protein [Durotheca rogersii]KAI5867590.1 PQ-loop-domain-containing protein [Durotheca rogersii]
MFSPPRSLLKTTLSSLFFLVANVVTNRVDMAAMLQNLSIHEAVSGVFGSISLTAWICLLLPQLITNYRAQSAEGLSMAFLAVWLFGDIANLSGSLVTGLAPTAAALAAYFCLSDVILISQSLYYKAMNARRIRRRARSAVSETLEDEPLLRPRRPSSVGLPGSHRRHSVHRTESSLDPIKRIVTGEDETPDSNPWFHNTVSVAAVYVVGATGWFISYKMGAWENSGGDNGASTPAGESPTAVIGEVLGYASALCYLCARIPQIVKNYQEKSCEGLALLFFLLSLTGNLTYGLSVFSYSSEPAYVIKAIPWLLGSFGTIVEDLIIFYQFRIYGAQSPVAKPDGAEETA